MGIETKLGEFFNRMSSYIWLLTQISAAGMFVSFSFLLAGKQPPAFGSAFFFIFVLFTISMGFLMEAEGRLRQVLLRGEKSDNLKQMGGIAVGVFVVGIGAFWIAIILMGVLAFLSLP